MARKNSQKVVRLFDGDRGQKAKANTQPSVRSTVLWTPDQVRAVQASAESGSLLRLADFCDTLMGDDRIQELLETRTGNLLGSELSFENSLHSKDRKPSKYSGQLDEDWWEAFPEDESAQLLSWGQLAGVSFGELPPWRQRDSGRVIPTLKFWHPKHFRWDWPKQTWFVRLGNNEELPIAPGDGRWVVYAPFGRYRPWAQGLWRGLAPWKLLKSYAISDWGVHSEKSSKHVLTASETATADMRKQVAADIFEMYKDAIIALPQGFDLKLVEVSANTRDIYNGQIEAANEAATIAILGQNLTTKVEGGSYAAAQTHATVELKRTRSDAATFSTTMRQQALSWWAEYNFGDAQQAPWPKFHVDPPEDKVQAAQTLQTVATAIDTLENAGYTIAPEAISEQFGIELTKMTPEEIAARQPPAPATPPPGKPGSPQPGRSGQPPKAKPVPKAQLAAKGFVSGQLYADDVSDAATEEASAEMEPFIAQLQQAIEDAKDYDALRSAVMKLYKAQRPPENFAQVLQRALVMTNLGGRFAVHEDRHG